MVEDTIAIRATIKAKPARMVLTAPILFMDDAGYFQTIPAGTEFSVNLFEEERVQITYPSKDTDNE